MRRFVRKHSVAALALFATLTLLVSTSSAATISANQTISETTTYSDGLTIAEGATLSAPQGKILTLTDAGVQKNIEAGTYAGPVVINVNSGRAVNNMGSNYTLQMGAYINNGTYDAANSVTTAIMGGTVTDTAATDVKIDSEGDYFNGIVVGGNSTYTIANPEITLNGHGGDDFAGYGSGITTLDNANVTIDGAVINTTGAIRTAIWAGGSSKILVKNTKVIAKDGTDLDFPVSMMREVPWILGLAGNLRATNVLGSGQATYLNSYVEAEKWGSLSTDSTSQGARLTTINTDIIVSGESGYGSYADGAIHNYYYGSRFDVPDMALIVAAGACGADFAKSSEANVGDLYADITSGKKDKPTTVKAGSFGVMWHKNQGGVTTVKENTVFDCGETVFLVKSDVNNTAYPFINVDESTLKSKTGVIFHLMESDDAGMGGGRPGSDTMWAAKYVIPTDTTPKKDANDPTAVNGTTVKANFSNMKMSGDIYNSRFSAGQNISVSFDNATIKGVISSGIQKHTLAEPGETVTKETYYKIGHVTVTPAETVANGVIVTLTNGSVWKVTGTSYLSSLTVDDSSSVKLSGGLTITVDGEAVSAKSLKGTTVKGDIVIAKK
jgi:hypothetical protein